MATIKRFEEILVWQEANRLAVMVYAVTCKGMFAKDFGLKDQIQRAAVSVSSNIAEGFSRSGNKEFTNFLWIATGSATEVQSQLHIAREIGYISDESFSEIYACAEKCGVMIYKFIKSLRTSSVSGVKHLNA